MHNIFQILITLLGILILLRTFGPMIYHLNCILKVLLMFFTNYCSQSVCTHVLCVFGRVLELVIATSVCVKPRLRHLNEPAETRQITVSVNNYGTR